MTDAERTRKVKQGHDGRIAASSFEVADVLLREAGDLGETLLGEALLLPKSRKVSAHQLAHVHARKLPSYILGGLSTIVCIW